MTDIANIPLTTIDGQPTNLNDYAGKVLLLVNVASKCGLTPQYEGLEVLYRVHKDDGLVVLGFPANNFMGQEPGTEADIASFCALTYDVTFPMFAKLSVKGADQHPLYAALTEAAPVTTGDEIMKAKLQSYGLASPAPGEVLWNFEKFLIGRDGQVKGRFSPDVTTDDKRLQSAINAELTA
jgi:glutathione peroxidase